MKNNFSNMDKVKKEMLKWIISIMKVRLDI